ncbi:tetratricopeptide repeat protein [candidate division KSB1 bacterium]|nr:tetratricopeptide repeat protein [candidate division KSB1 bacterium]
MHRRKTFTLLIIGLIVFSCTSTKQTPIQQNGTDALAVENQVREVFVVSSAQEHDSRELTFLDSVNTLHFTFPSDIGFLKLSNKINSSLVFDNELKQRVEAQADVKQKIAFLEFQFHYLNAAQRQLSQHYYLLGNDERLRNMLKFVVDNNEYGWLKGQFVGQMLQFASTENGENKQRSWHALEKMLTSIDWRNSEKDDQKVQRSPVGARIPRKAITNFLREQEKVSSGIEEEHYVLAAITRIRHTKIKFQAIETDQLTYENPQQESEYEQFITQLSGLFQEAAESDDLQRKLELYTQIIELDPGNATAYFNRAVCYLSMQNPESALLDLTATARIDPAFQKLHLYTAMALMQQKKFAAAIPELNAALTSDKSAFPYFKRAMCYMELNQLPHAMEDFSRAIALDSSNTVYFNNRALSNLKLKKYSIALDDFHAILSLEPQNVSAWYNTGLCHWKLRQWQQSVDAWEKCLSIDPAYENARHSLPRARKYAAIAARKKVQQHKSK